MCLYLYYNFQTISVMFTRLIISSFYENSTNTVISKYTTQTLSTKYSIECFGRQNSHRTPYEPSSLQTVKIYWLLTLLWITGKQKDFFPEFYCVPTLTIHWLMKRCFYFIHTFVNLTVRNFRVISCDNYWTEHIIWIGITFFFLILRP